MRRSMLSGGVAEIVPISDISPVYVRVSLHTRFTDDPNPAKRHGLAASGSPPELKRASRSLPRNVVEPCLDKQHLRPCLALPPGQWMRARQPNITKHNGIGIGIASICTDIANTARNSRASLQLQHRSHHQHERQLRRCREEQGLSRLRTTCPGLLESPFWTRRAPLQVRTLTKSPLRFRLVRPVPCLQNLVTSRPLPLFNKNF